MIAFYFDKSEADKEIRADIFLSEFHNIFIFYDVE